MRFFIRAIKRGGNHVDRDLNTHQLSIGRGEDQDIRVSSQRVGLCHAIIESAEGGEIQIRANTPLGVLHNGQAIKLAAIKPGDIIEIGNCKIALHEPPAGFDCSIEIEETRFSQGKELQSALLARSNLEFDNTGLRMRAWAWRLSLAILILLFLIPLAGFVYQPLGNWLRSITLVSDVTWNSGPISRSHSAFGNDCNVCHEKAFISVRDSACVDCHKAMPHHIEANSKKVKDFEPSRCASCHKEHTDKQTFVPRDEGLCVGCHGQINHQAPDARLLNVSGFGEKHPEFKATLISVREGKETASRVSLGQKTELKEHSNLEFSHKDHLDKKGVKNPSRGVVHLECNNCHEPEKDGRYMIPVNFETHCHECHQLTFEAWDPKREVPHGDANKAQAFLQTFYSNLAFSGDFLEFASNHEEEEHLRRPGDVLPLTEIQQPSDWVHDYSQGVTTELFRYRACGGCHRVSRNSVVSEVSKPTWKIEPVRVAKSWLPKARFSHQSHKTMKCSKCHDAESSNNSEDVMIKGIDSCRQCHGDANSVDKVASTCIDCHGFHVSKSLAMTGEKLISSRKGLLGKGADPSGNANLPIGN
jgi:predicted CXXCH cytochrome family protein